jgi:hypothetical protein
MNAQLALSFGIWITYGIWRRRRADRLRDKMALLSRRLRVGLSIGSLILSAVILFAGLSVFSSYRGIQEGPYSGWLWFAMTLVGLVFVHMQTLGSVAMVSVVLEDQRNLQNRRNAQNTSVEDRR